LTIGSYYTIREIIMKKFIKAAVFTTALFIYSSVFAITGGEAVKKMQERLSSINKMTGVISWLNSSGKSYTGSFQYMNPGNIYVKFSNPRGKELVTNGKKLWVYDPIQKVCGIQNLSEKLSGGLGNMLRGYMAIISSQAPDNYIIKLKNPDRYYSDIELSLDSTFLMKKIIITNRNGKSTSFSISNINLSATIMKNIFDYKVPANTQLIKNPLNPR